jgi:hypothetical protein
MKTFKRLFIRTVLLAVLTVAGFSLMPLLTITTGWPEVLQCLKAAAVLAWAEHSIMIVRIVMQPRIDVQEAPRLATLDDGYSRPNSLPVDAQACAIVYGVHQFTWAVRMVVFVLLYGVL